MLTQLVTSYLKTDLPRLLIPVGAALLVVLIPLVIAIFATLRDNVLDRNVLLDYIVGAKKFLLIFLLIFIPPLLLPILPFAAGLLMLAVYLFGIFLMMKVLGRLYKWIKTDKNELRYNYLSKLKDEADLRESWHSFWQNNKIEFGAELKFSGLFCSSLSQYLKKEEFQSFRQFAALYSDYSQFISSRNPMLFISGPASLHEFFGWHYKISRKEQDLRGDSPEPTAGTDLHIWAEYYEFLGAFNRSLIEIYNILNNNRASLNLYRALDDHVTSHTDNIEYASNFIGSYYDYFLENYHNFQHKDNALRTFPGKWRITKKDLAPGATSLFSRVLWNRFAHWAIERISKASDKTDVEMEAIIREFFPEVDPISWSKLLIFSLTPPYSQNRVKCFIERPWNFGLIGRIHTFGGDISKSSFADDDEAATNSTIELAFTLFGNDYNLESIKNYITEIECLEYKNNDLYEKRKKYISNVFKKMLQLLEQKELRPQGS